MANKNGETTYVLPRTGDEVMVWRVGGKVTDVYASRDARFLTSAGKAARKIDPDCGYAATKAQFAVRWKPGLNPAFVHASKPVAAFNFVSGHGVR